MEITYNNIKFDVKEFPNGYNEMLGDSCLTLNSDESIKAFVELVQECQFDIEHNDGIEINNEYTISGRVDLETLFDTYTLDEEDEEKELIDTVCIYNNDAQIVYLAWIFSEPGEFNMHYESESVLWLLHDCIHAENDCSGTSVYVDDYAEERAIKDSLVEACERDLVIDFGLVGRTAVAYEKRFQRPLSLDLKMKLQKVG